jgi:hypothetical protein
MYGFISIRSSNPRQVDVKVIDRPQNRWVTQRLTLRSRNIAERDWEEPANLLLADVPGKFTTAEQCETYMDAVQAILKKVFLPTASTLVNSPL